MAAVAGVRGSPVRAVGPTLPGIGGLLVATRNIRARQTVSQLSRKELEDKYFRLRDENILLKQKANKQEDTIKRMAIRITRLANDKKRSELVGGGPKRLGHNLELEKLVESLKLKVCDLEKYNEILRSKLISNKQQRPAQSRRPIQYRHAQSLDSIGFKKPDGDAGTLEHTKKEVRLQEPEVAPPKVVPRKCGPNLLEDARAKIRNMESEIDFQKERIGELEQLRDLLRTQLNKKEKEAEESTRYLKEQEVANQRSSIRDNVEMIKIRKQLAEKNNALSEMESDFLQLQENQRNLKASHDALIARSSDLNHQLKEERLKNLHLENELQSVALTNKRTEELQERINDLEQEKELLRKDYEKLSKSIFNMTQEQDWKLKEEQLKLQIAELETAVKSSSADKDKILDQMNMERDQKEKLMQENKELQSCCLENKKLLEELKDRMKYLTKRCDADGAEVSSEVLSLTKVQKQQKNGDLLCLEKDEDDILKDLEGSMQKLQLTHVETVQELEKTRQMLVVQQKITKGYKSELEIVTQKMESLQKEYESKIEKYVHLLDSRTERIRKLEAQLKDVAYSTKQFKYRPETVPGNPPNKFDESQHLERGEGLFEFHISKVKFSSAAVNAFGDNEPAAFCSYSFYDFETQSTPVLHGHTLSYDLTFQYIVKIDDIFLHYIQSESVTLEVHRARGSDYETVAACQLTLQEILEQNGRIYTKAVLVGKSGNIPDFGTIEYWIRLRAPMDHSIGLYKKNSKARGYVTPDLREDESQCQPVLRTAQVSTSTDGDLNELHVTVKCCNHLQSRKKHLQPNSYVVYRFFDFAYHDTPIIPSSTNPQIDDVMCFQMPVTADLDRYLKWESLTFFLFDDTEIGEDSYLGKANVPLIPLACNRPISGTFEITDSKRRVIGAIRVELKWKFEYLTPSGATVAAGLENDIQNEKSMVPKLRSEQDMQPPIFFPAGEESSARVKQESVTVLEVKESAREIQQEEEDGSRLSERQLNGQSSDTSGNQTEKTEKWEPKDGVGRHTNDSIESENDSDDCIISSPLFKNIKQASEKIRFEIISLCLTESRILEDDTIRRLFVECRLYNLVAEETPVSLPKPMRGQWIHYNYSNVIYVDKENNSERREYLKSILQRPPPDAGSLLFTVVSDPLDDEPDLECEDIGFAYVNLREIFQSRRDIIEKDICVFDSQDDSAIIGKLRVTVEALHALHAVYKEWKDGKEA
ncbi:protein fantom isoform X2 [Coturnix japonica]|uniref:RPGRIP1 like n=1 Tax=Coturnix japonica TaxID=93934 RepID=A0A8C2TNM5_COTJA|nr:protein fantom isoform X2 [Coturnix japonica]